MLRVDGLEVRYGPVAALRGVSLEVAAGETVCLLGANGAGKSSLLNAVSALVRPTAGRIEFDGRAVDARVSPHELVGRGLVQIPEGRQLFRELTVLENLRLGAYVRGWDRTAAALLEETYAWFPVLRERRRQPAGSLSGGEQQMLAIGRALMARPRLLLIDEPSLGLAPLVVQGLFGRIREIGRRGLAVLLVEQNAALALGVAGRGYVLETGRIVLAGTAGELSRSDAVRRAYLGGEPAPSA
ncbi:MAG TPA: ABC transporter ATP-binding protein [Methylomirabilota bacterium]|jgi:branched-chain amino acid transport system ATP-binding protein|nr:ABC transporter ATP-binding protein [Methylomirabilota bacterium]